MDRRDFFAGAGAGLLAAGSSLAARAAQPSAESPAAGSFEAITRLARELSGSPFNPSKTKLTGPFVDLEYDKYRAIRTRTIPISFERDGFAIDMLPPGFIFQDPVKVSLVSDTGVHDIPFTMDLFEFDPKMFQGQDLSDTAATRALGFSGFRLRYRINRVDYPDEFAVFQGASYFRAIARNTIFGLSARGLAIRTGDPRGEEFPVFRHFWIVQPEHRARSITVRALLDSASCTGAFEFVISPGETTSMNTRCVLFPREEIDNIGIAPLTSMFLFGPQGRSGADDYRSAVHDSEGLQMITGRGERLWRPLNNPRLVQVSAFQDNGPKAFGLTQRRRDFDHYQDDEAHYERRPTGWVEPLDDWGGGAVVLVEIPTEHEFNDNIVAFWRPQKPLGPTPEGHRFAYMLLWCAAPPDSGPLARVHATRSGSAIYEDGKRVLVVDFERKTRWPVPPQIEITPSKGEVNGVAMRDLPGGMLSRASFKFTPAQEELLEFQLVLVGPDAPESEKWLYRWTPG